MKYANHGFRKQKSINRNPSDTGWTVSLRWKNQIYTRTFSDSLGGVRQALKLAIFWRDMTENKIGKPRSEHRVYKKFKPLWWKYPELREIPSR